MIANRVGVWVVVALIAACSHTREADRDSAAGAVAAFPPVAFTPPDSVALREGSQALADYLDASREGSPRRDRLATLTACPDGETSAQGPMLATFEILPPTARADTVVARAVVTTVAEQDVDRIHRGYFIARMRVRRDTLEWDVLRTESGDRVICNGLRFGLTAPDSLTAWRPNGASLAAARALADSIAQR